MSRGWSRLDSDYNIWSANFEGRFFGERTIAEWRAVSNREQNSTLSDSPGFVDADARDYRLQSGALGSGFGTDILNLQGAGTDAPINAGPFISPEQDDIIGMRPVEITNAEPLDWEYPYA